MADRVREVTGMAILVHTQRRTPLLRTHMLTRIHTRMLIRIPTTIRITGVPDLEW